MLAGCSIVSQLKADKIVGRELAGQIEKAIGLIRFPSTHARVERAFRRPQQTFGKNWLRSG
jgi:hypothetical protein